jgi:hypothetical protein
VNGQLIVKKHLILKRNLKGRALLFWEREGFWFKYRIPFVIASLYPMHYTLKAFCTEYWFKKYRDGATAFDKEIKAAMIKLGYEEDDNGSNN